MSAPTRGTPKRLKSSTSAEGTEGIRALQHRGMEPVEKPLAVGTGCGGRPSAPQLTWYGVVELLPVTANVPCPVPGVAPVPSEGGA